MHAAPRAGFSPGTLLPCSGGTFDASMENRPLVAKCIKAFRSAPASMAAATEFVFLSHEYEDRAGVVTFIADAVRSLPHPPKARYVIGSLLLDAGDFEAAREWFNGGDEDHSMGLAFASKPQAEAAAMFSLPESFSPVGSHLGEARAYSDIPLKMHECIRVPQSFARHLALVHSIFEVDDMEGAALWASQSLLGHDQAPESKYLIGRLLMEVGCSRKSLDWFDGPAEDLRRGREEALALQD